MSLTKLSLGGNNWIIPVQRKSGQWFPGWGRENGKPFLTVYCPPTLGGWWCQADSIVFIIEDQAFSTFSPPPSPVSKLSFFLSLPVCRPSILPTGWGEGWRRSQTIRRQESLVLYKLFIALWCQPYIHVCTVLNCLRIGWWWYKNKGKSNMLFTVVWFFSSLSLARKGVAGGGKALAKDDN